MPLRRGDVEVALEWARSNKGEAPGEDAMAVKLLELIRSEHLRSYTYHEKEIQRCEKALAGLGADVPEDFDEDDDSPTAVFWRAATKEKGDG